LGHECAGTVLSVGSAVTDKFKPGDRVAVEPGTGCGSCPRCREGRYNLCPDMRFLGSIMSNYPGALRTRMAHPAETCFKLPDHVSFDEAAMLEPLSVGVQACKRGRVKTGDSVLIGGAGPVGFLTMLVAKAAGAARIGMTDINLPRLEFARDYGEGSNCEIFEMPGAEIPDGWDVAIECTGAVSSTECCIEKLRTGATIVLVGHGSQNLDIRPILTKELDMMGVFRYCDTYPTCLDLVASGKIDVKPMVTHHFGLDEINEAINAGLTDPTAIKVIVHPNR
jgi:L-iditol 2-dehydrogenase